MRRVGTVRFRLFRGIFGFAIIGLMACSLNLTAKAAPFYLPSLYPDGYLSVYHQSAYFDIQQGCAEIEQGAFEKAAENLQKAVEKNPTSVMAQYNLGYSLMQLGEHSKSDLAKGQELEDAEWTFQRVQNINPELTLTYYKLGKLALLRNDPEAARKYYLEGLENSTDNFALYFNLGAVYEKLHNIPKAKEAYRKVIEINPKFVLAYNNLGLIYEDEHDFSQAEDLYKEALSQSPGYNYARLNLGNLLQSQGRLDEAEVQYKEALRYEPENGWTYLYLGNTYFRKGDYKQALSAYHKSVDYNPHYATTYYLMSLVLEKLDRPDEALANGLQYIHLAPDGDFSQEAQEMIMVLKQNHSQVSTSPK